MIDLTLAGLVVSVFLNIMVFVVGWRVTKRGVALENNIKYTQEVYDELLEQNKEDWKHEFIDEGVEYIVLPTKPVYDVLEHQMAGFANIVVRNYIEKYGEYNVDAAGNTLVVQERGSDGRFV